MIIRKTEKLGKVWVVTGNGEIRKRHIEKKLITTYWLMFIPLYTYSKTIGSNL